ncbi:MAG: hypothetical protein R2864_07680 [Syntrophotaleaceae bacterium]
MNLQEVKLKNGPLTLQVTATDQALLTNTVSESFTLDYDSRPPVVSVLTRAHNLNQSGAGLVLYKVSEEVERSGVQIGDTFFPGYLQDEGFYACLFAFPFDMPQSQFLPRVVAVDKAGNERQSRLLLPHQSPPGQTRQHQSQPTVPRQQDARVPGSLPRGRQHARHLPEGQPRAAGAEPRQSSRSSAF